MSGTDALALSIFTANGFALFLGFILLLTYAAWKAAKKEDPFSLDRTFKVFFALSGILTLAGSMVSLWANSPSLSVARWLSLPYLAILVTLGLRVWRTGRQRKSLVVALKDARTQSGLAAIERLGSHKGRAARKALLAALGNEVPEVRLAAVKALGQMNDRRSVEPLIAAFQQGDRELRVAVLSALGKIRAKRSLEVLIPSLADADESVRSAALSSLRLLTSEVRANDALAFFGRYGIPETEYPHRAECSRCRTQRPCQRYEIRYGRKAGERVVGSRRISSDTREVTRQINYEILGSKNVYLCKECQGQLIRRRVTGGAVQVALGVVLIPTVIIGAILILLGARKFTRQVSNHDNLEMLERYAVKVTRRELRNTHPEVVCFAPGEYEGLHRARL